MKMFLSLFLTVTVLLAQSPFGTGTGDYAMWPFASFWYNANSGLQTWSTLNGSTLKAAHCGYVSTPGQATKTLRNLHLMIGAVTKTGGTDLRVGIQAPSTATAFLQPSGTWADSGTAFATIGDASITANTWLRSGDVGGSLSVSHGSLWCVVVEPENYAGSDSYVLRGANQKSTGHLWFTASTYNGATWATSVHAPMHLLEFSDGTFGTVGLGNPLNSVGTLVGFNSGSTPDEYALKLTPAVTLSAAGMCALNPYNTATGDFEWVLYEGTTQLVAVVADATSNSSYLCALFPSAITLTAGATYYAAIKPTNANNIQIAWSGVADNAYWAVYGGGFETSYSTRTNAGAWSDTATRRPHINLLLSGAGSTGGSGGGAYVVAQ